MFSPDTSARAQPRVWVVLGWLARQPPLLVGQTPRNRGVFSFNAPDLAPGQVEVATLTTFFAGIRRSVETLHRRTRRIRHIYRPPRR
jgi:hypothetical protein